ncbi:hypothetical protein GMOD_00009147 [Pyrenophora seminiperda CCB06]|uniref:Uncharacterized protein n=1 Tax=Pyrenophora seminiperda CCB06 TaxID=1302712 RepID=A0A3M7MBP4_9PLEO|nr:hypothetical protein GMOD_00009147 [Pyrenophora seminiperda CCB06]
MYVQYVQKPPVPRRRNGHTVTTVAEVAGNTIAGPSIPATPIPTVYVIRRATCCHRSTRSTTGTGSQRDQQRAPFSCLPFKIFWHYSISNGLRTGHLAAANSLYYQLPTTALEHTRHQIHDPLIFILFTSHRHTEQMLTRIYTINLKHPTLQHSCKVDQNALNRSLRLLANRDKVAPRIQVVPDDGDVEVLMRSEAGVWAVGALGWGDSIITNTRSTTYHVRLKATKTVYNYPQRLYDRICTNPKPLIVAWGSRRIGRGEFGRDCSCLAILVPREYEWLWWVATVGVWRFGSTYLLHPQYFLHFASWQL